MIHTSITVIQDKRSLKFKGKVLIRHYPLECTSAKPPIALQVEEKRASFECETRDAAYTKCIRYIEDNDVGT